MSGFKALLDGYRRFRSGAYQEQRARYDVLAATGQTPRVMVIACSDSRVDPSVVFDTEPGQMFVVRNVANLVPPYETGGGYHGASAAIEFAVTQLEVEHIVILGHGLCGGIHASLTGVFDDADVGEGHFIGHWMQMIRPARDRVRAAAALSPDVDAPRALEQAAIRLSLENLMSFPFVAERVSGGCLQLQGAYFAISDGILRVLNPDTDRFEPVELDWQDRP